MVTWSVKRAVALALSVVLGAGSVALAAPASAAEVAFSVDDFAGNQMGTRELLVPGEWSCDYYDNAAMNVDSGTMRIALPATDSRGCTYPSTGVVWTAPSSVNIEQGGADRLQLRYRDVTPNEPSAVTFGIRAVDVNGRVAQVGGLTRNGGPGSDFLTIRYAPEYPGDVSVLRFDSGFDKSQVKSITLYVAATRNNQPVGVTFEGIGANVGEPNYVAPSIQAATSYRTSTTETTTIAFDVLGYPAPDVSVHANGFAASATVAKSTDRTAVTVTVPASASPYSGTLQVSASVANSLTAQRTVQVINPSPITVTQSATTMDIGTTSATLATLASTPWATELTDVSGVPGGLTLALSGNELLLSGTPSQAGSFQISGTVANDYSEQDFSLPFAVTQAPALEPVELTLVRGVEMAPYTIEASGFPEPTFTVSALPAGLALSADGVLTGTPTALSDMTSTVTATNTVGEAHQSITVTVGDLPTIDVPASATWTTDLEANLDLTLTGAESLIVTGLPAGVSWTSAGNLLTLTGTPSLLAGADVATGDVRIEATNAFGSTVEVLPWRVERRERPVVMADAAVAGVAGSALSIDVGLAGFPAPTVALENAPAWLTVEATSAGARLVGTPPTSGDVTVTIVATNAAGEHRSPVTISVAAPSATIELSASTVEVGGTVGVKAEGLLPGDEAEVWLNSDPQLIATGQADASGTLVLSATVPQGTPAGDHTVVVRAVSGATASAPISVTVPAEAEPEVPAEPEPTVTPTPTPSDAGEGTDDASGEEDVQEPAGNGSGGTATEDTAGEGDPAEGGLPATGGSVHEGLVLGVVLLLAVGGALLGGRRRV